LLGGILDKNDAIPFLGAYNSTRYVSEVTNRRTTARKEWRGRLTITLILLGATKLSITNGPSTSSFWIAAICSWEGWI
jgi:hypothetical protein